MDKISEFILVWLVSATVTLPLAILTVRSYKVVNSKLSGILAALFSLSVLAMFTWSIPLIFIRDETILNFILIIGDLLWFTALLLNVYLFWYLLLRKYMEPTFIMAGGIIVYIYLLYIELFSHTVLENGKRVMIEGDSIQALDLPTAVLILYIPFLINGIYFLLNARVKNAFYVRLRHVMLGLLFIFIPLSEAYNIVVDGSGVDQTGSVGVVLMVFIIIFLILFGVVGGVLKRKNIAQNAVDSQEPTDFQNR